jgi:gamma-glutamylcyclotransferase (GGCT)/AIG2-like uncharacterized protein YtfP
MNESQADHFLAVYGSLAPGEVNAHVLASLNGSWQPGLVRGVLHREGWGWTKGFPGLRLAASGELVPVMLFHSADLPAHWERLDEFEGEEYERRVTTVTSGDAQYHANIYVLL